MIFPPYFSIQLISGLVFFAMSDLEIKIHSAKSSIHFNGSDHLSERSTAVLNRV